MRRKYLLIAQIIEYVSSFIYFFIAALFYSMSNKLYWLFFIFALIVLIIGLYTETIKHHVLINDYLKKYEIGLYIVSGLSILTPPALVFNILAIFNNEDEVDEEEPLEIEKYEPKEKKPVISLIVACSSLLLMLIIAFIEMIVETSGFKVAIKYYKITKEETDIYNKGAENALNGQNYTIDDPTVYYSYTLYKPKDASSTNPYPVVFVLPGFTRTKASMSQYAIEFSRRGAVVFVLDPGSQGASSYAGYEYDENGELKLDQNGNKTHNSYNIASSGLGYLVQYVYNNVEEFDYIDRDQIGLVGHSAGGGDVCKLASEISGANYNESIVKALYISGYIKISAANRYYNLRCNAAMSYAKYDEGSFRYQDENQAYEVIALRFINEVNSKTNGANGVFTYFEEEKEYGDLETGTYRIIHHEDINHCFEMYDKLSISNTINFFKKTLGLNDKYKDTNQVWGIKEISTGLMLALAFTLVISLVSVIVNYVKMDISF